MQSPKLFDRGLNQLIEDGQALAQLYTPEWTAFADRQDAGLNAQGVRRCPAGRLQSLRMRDPALRARGDRGGDPKLRGRSPRWRRAQGAEGRTRRSSPTARHGVATAR